MNSLEREMLELLRRGREQYGFVALKAEFEAEGTRPDEFQRLLELAHNADLKVALKIGGCEAVTDLLAGKLYGVDYVIAPMVETPYALTKYAGIIDSYFSEDERQDATFLFNLETLATLSHLDELVKICRQRRIDGFVFGRVDFTLSQGLPRTAVNDDVISEAVLKVAEACHQADQQLVVGGSVAEASISCLRRFRQVRLDRFETRKVVFDGAAAESDELMKGLQTSIRFELNWLQNKSEYYARIAAEDRSRIEMIRKRVVD